jgi:hypothetical protein
MGVFRRSGVADETTIIPDSSAGMSFIRKITET